MATDLGLIVGSGFDRLALDIVGRRAVTTPYGAPSGPLLEAICGGRPVTVLARHGQPHTLAPHEVNYRANVWALHSAGVRRLVAVNVVGAIAAGFETGELAVPEQLIDYTTGRDGTFGGRDGAVVHVDFTVPFDVELAAAIRAAIERSGARANGGVYGVTQGPRLETAAEIDRLERDGCTMVGMTAMPEAALARELGIRYAICAVAVNRAAGRAGAVGGIHAEMERHLGRGMARVGQVLARLIPALADGAL